MYKSTTKKTDTEQGLLKMKKRLFLLFLNMYMLNKKLGSIRVEICSETSFMNMTIEAIRKRGEGIKSF